MLSGESGTSAARVAFDTSVAVPWVMQSHPQHDTVHAAVSVRRPSLTGQSLVETYSVLTRLAGDARLAPRDAATVIERSFGPALILSETAMADVVTELGRRGVAGGAVYDALVAMAAVEARVPLVTRDLRAAATYTAVGVTLLTVGSTI